ncbi:MAG: heparan-alpha-glucosaminide N-acetyltransferase domain-containing protein [Coriobacteriales bacterium]|nr:heparan-alpha-glucosaminide N-acetyltransferase domain-containing protein [Coriobacteriales bacterium]
MPAQKGPSTKHLTESGTRVHIFDVARGFSVISMVLFHFCYDLRYLANLPIAWFAPPFQDIWRCSISWAFVFIAGCMFAWSRNNLKRSLRYLAVAALVFIVTTLVAVDTPINFGIIYCMGSCTLVAWLLDTMHIRPTGPAAAIVLGFSFLMLLHISKRVIGLGPLATPLPDALYATPYLSWLGFPGPGFASGDYYPLLPYLLLYLAGSAMGRYWKQTGIPQAFYDITNPFLESIGQHALPIYVLHQPVLLLLTMAIVSLT